MSPEALADLAARAFALGAAAHGARLALRLGGRVALDQGLYAGVGAFGFLHLARHAPDAVALAGAGGVAAGLGAALGALTAPLAPARAAAVGLALQVGAVLAAPRVPAWTGGYMGLAGALPHPGRVAGLIGGALAIALLLELALARAPAGVAGLLRLRVEAPATLAALGVDQAPLAAGVGALQAGLAGLGGAVLGAALEHLHASSFGLERSLDALAIALLGGGRLGLAAGAAGLSLAEEGLAAWPAARTGLVAGVLLAAALRSRGRS